MAYLDQQPLSQGEITFLPVTPDHFEGAALGPAETDGQAWIVAHSESGHHHVIDRARADVAQVQHDSAGLTILRAIVTDPEGAVVVNKGSHGHADLHLPPGLYEARINRELGLDDVVRRAAD